LVCKCPREEDQEEVGVTVVLHLDFADPDIVVPGEELLNLSR
jgi:hypothetical protein